MIINILFDIINCNFFNCTKEIKRIWCLYIYVNINIVTWIFTNSIRRIIYTISRYFYANFAFAISFNYLTILNVIKCYFCFKLVFNLCLLKILVNVIYSAISISINRSNNFYCKIFMIWWPEVISIMIRYNIASSAKINKNSLFTQRLYTMIFLNIY